MRFSSKLTDSKEGGHENLQFVAKLDRSCRELRNLNLHLTSDVGGGRQACRTEPLACRTWFFLQLDSVRTEWNCRRIACWSGDSSLQCTWMLTPRSPLGQAVANGVRTHQARLLPWPKTQDCVFLGYTGLLVSSGEGRKKGKDPHPTV